MALYRVEEHSPEGRRGDVIALGLYVYAGVDLGSEEGQARNILEEATQVEIHQGRAPVGARMMFMGIWSGGPALGVVSGRRADRGREGRVVAEVWGAHFALVGLSVEEGGEGEGRVVGLSRREVMRSKR